eukprot:9482723-Pyramimonas_sp.AAC.1
MARAGQVRTKGAPDARARAKATPRARARTRATAKASQTVEKEKDHSAIDAIATDILPRTAPTLQLHIT